MKFHKAVLLVSINERLLECITDKIQADVNTIDISANGPGVYVLIWKDENAVSNHKIIVE